MNKTITILLISFVTIASSTVFADEKHHEKSTETQNMTGMMDRSTMQKHMEKMQNIMNKISESKDPNERQKLMASHMKEMHKGMDMMKGMTMGDMGGGKMMPGDSKQKNGNMEMMKRQDMMEQRMDMMQMMSEQMMDHMMEGLQMK